MLKKTLLLILTILVSNTSFSSSVAVDRDRFGFRFRPRTVDGSVSSTTHSPENGTVTATETETVTDRGVAPDVDYLLSDKVPYTPRDTEYSVEIGAMAERRSLYWVAANVGQHVGRCIFTSSQTCQQYVDGIAGVGGRDAETFGVFLGSLRWQFVNFPRSWSPLFRVAAGPMRLQTADEDGWRFVYGIGIGAIAFLHDKVDLRLESRVLQSEDHTMGQAMLSIHFKADRLLIYFAEKLEEIGLSTVRGVTAPFRSSDKPKPEDKTQK